MSTPLRFIPEEAKRWTNKAGEPIAVVEVTIRTLLGIYLVKPTDRNRSLILGVLGRAQERIGFELYGYAYLSNHGSLLVGVRDSVELARLMEYIHGNIARELGRKEQSNWAGRFWGRRGRPILVLTDEDLVGRMRYLLANSTKEGLVVHPARWPGAHCARALCEGRADHGVWVDRTKLRLLRTRASQKRPVAQADATTHYRVRLDKLPCWTDLSDAQYQQRIREMCHDIRQQAVLERKLTKRPVLGRKRVLRMSPHHRPDQINRSPAPAVHCRDRGFRQWFIDAYRSFVAGYRAACKRLGALVDQCDVPPGGMATVVAHPL